MAALDPAAARARVLAAYKAAKMHVATVAKVLGVDPATLRRLVERLGMRPALERLGEQARRQGWHHGRAGGYPAGRPRKAVVSEAGKRARKIALAKRREARRASP